MNHTTDAEDFDIFYKAALQVWCIYQQWAAFYWANPWLHEAPPQVRSNVCSGMFRTEVRTVETLLANLQARRPSFARDYPTVAEILVGIAWEPKTVPTDWFESAIRLTWNCHLDGTLKERWERAGAEVDAELRSKRAA